MNYDIFNGDADGICSLIQLRLAEPRKATLISGVKRDIKLLQKIKANGDDKVTVLDISMEKNIEALKEILTNGASVFYADHHRSGEIPKHKKLEAHIDLSSKTCTALIVDKYLKGQYKTWALTAAFGDNLAHIANPLAKKTNLSDEETSLLSQLGTYLNYNGYGAKLDDLFYHPADLYSTLVNYECPLRFIQEQAEIFLTLRNGYEGDMAKAQQLKAYLANDTFAIFILPNEKWARRVSGVFSNELVNKFPNRAHAVLTEKDDSNYLASIRAPKNNPYGADEISTQFPSGGGRKTAAGINSLPQKAIKNLASLLENYYSATDT